MIGEAYVGHSGPRCGELRTCRCCVCWVTGIMKGCGTVITVGVVTNITGVWHSHSGCGYKHHRGVTQAQWVWLKTSQGCGTVRVCVVANITGVWHRHSGCGYITGVWHSYLDRSPSLNISAHSGGGGTVQTTGPRSRVQHSWWKGVHSGLRGCG